MSPYIFLFGRGYPAAGLAEMGAILAGSLDWLGIVMTAQQGYGLVGICLNYGSSEFL